MGLSVKSYCDATGQLSAAAGAGTLIYNDATDTSPREYADGTGNGQANKIYTSMARSLAASANEELDLAGVLLDPAGAALTFSAVKGIFVEAAAANTNDVVVGNAASNGFVGPFGGATHTIAVKPGGKLLIEAPNTGWTVTAGTGDKLKILNGAAGTSVAYDIKIWGI